MDITQPRLSIAFLVDCQWHSSSFTRTSLTESRKLSERIQAQISDTIPINTKARDPGPDLDACSSRDALVLRRRLKLPSSLRLKQSNQKFPSNGRLTRLLDDENPTAHHCPVGESRKGCAIRNELDLPCCHIHTESR